MTTDNITISSLIRFWPALLAISVISVAWGEQRVRINSLESQVSQISEVIVQQAVFQERMQVIQRDISAQNRKLDDIFEAIKNQRNRPND